MQLLYISPSTLPSNSANSIHVVQQCIGLCDLGVSVTLVALRDQRKKNKLLERVKQTYGIDTVGFSLVTAYNPFRFGNQIFIALRAIFYLAFSKKICITLSRNLYAAWFVACVLKRPILFETHQLENGLRRILQRFIVTRRYVTTIVISKKLKNLLGKHLGCVPFSVIVLHDSAPEGIKPIQDKDKRKTLKRIISYDLNHYTSIVGYFGQLYPGRGIDLIKQMAKARPNILFLVFGGNYDDILHQRANNVSPNLKYCGFVPNDTARNVMASCDILLMPYQRSVSIGIKGHDTAKWMSPMKMFEYLGSGSAIISSDLEVLREVLKHEENALLVPPDDIKSWLNAIDNLEINDNLRLFIGHKAHLLYKKKYTWRHRGSKLIEAGLKL